MDNHSKCLDCGKERPANIGGICNSCLGQTEAKETEAKYLPYAGIGSRETPNHILNLMTRIATRMEELGFTLRSGGAQGADTAFEKGTKEIREIYLPWPGYGYRKSSDGAIVPFKEPWLMEDALRISANAHPAWNNCSNAVRSLHARNVAQVLGPDLLSHSKLVICWTRGASGGGGTGQALRIAKQVGIPIFDLGACDKTQDYDEFLKEMGDFVLSLCK